MPAPALHQIVRGLNDITALMCPGIGVFGGRRMGLRGRVTTILRQEHGSGGLDDGQSLGSDLLGRAPPKMTG